MTKFKDKTIKDFNLSYPVINMLIEYLEMEINMIFMLSKDNTPEKLKIHVEEQIKNSKLFQFLGIYPIFQESNKSMMKFVSEYVDIEKKFEEKNYDDLKMYLDYVNYSKINNIRERILACNVYIDFEILIDKIKDSNINEKNNYEVKELVDYLTSDLNDKVSSFTNNNIIN